MSNLPVSPRGEVVVYQSTDGQVRVDVRLEQDTVWLTVDQMAELFGRHRTVILRHLRNIFAAKELERAATVAKNAQVQLEGGREITRRVESFNLDAIISVGYRVSSKRGTQFRIWATRTLRDHLVRGFTLNERRLQEVGLSDAQQAIGLLSRTLGANALVSDEGQGVVEVIRHYARTWHWLFEYGAEASEKADGRTASIAPLTLVEARTAIDALREWIHACGQAPGLFGRELDDSLDGVLAAIDQTFDRQPLYRTAQERAAHLLYFAVKDHPFADGNKRIGALLFLEYLRRHGLLLRADSQPRLADTAVAALTILIAESRPAQRDLMVRLVVSLLGDVPTRRTGPETVAEPRVSYHPPPGWKSTRTDEVLNSVSSFTTPKPGA